MTSAACASPWRRRELSDEKDIQNIQKTLDLLEDDDDVQNVYHNWDM